jgi:secreted trypsin-like serine protease
MIACALIVALFLPASSLAAPGASASIIGGKATPISELPWLAYIEASNGSSGFACTGTVIAPRVILTAGHCADDLEQGGLTPPREYAVVTGVTDIAQVGPAAALEVSETHVFPGFDPGRLTGDAALLILAQPTTAPALPLAGAADAALYAGGASVRLAGWGLTNGRARRAPSALRSATLTVLDDPTCKRKTRNYPQPFSPGEEFCALDQPAHKGSGCHGDSGGPAIAARPDGTPVEIGVISSGGPNCSSKQPNLLTRADLISTWAAEWIGATEAGAPPPLVDNSLPLPRMERQTGEEFALLTLLSKLGDSFLSAKSVNGSCSRHSASAFKCRIQWRTSRFSFAGTVSPFYLRQRGAVVWNSHFQFRRVDLACQRRGQHCQSIRVIHG